MASKNKLSPLPADFIWGVSTSGYQSEGGHVDSNWDRYNAATPSQDRYGKAVDFRHRYREDIALARDLGCNTFRIGINWARVEPRRGEFDETELAYYDDVLLAMKQAGIATLITLDHFVYPGWVGDQGAWTSAQTCADFVRYSQMIAQRYHADVKLWLTFNEAAFFTLIEWKYRKMKWAQVRLMRQHLISAHRQVYDLIHSLDTSAMVSSNIVWCGRGWRSVLLQRFTDWLFLDGIADKMDCSAFDYYYHGVTKELLAGRIWEVDPDPSGIAHAIRKLARRYPKIPVLIAENGMPTDNAQPRADGIRREDVLRDSVYWMQRARDEGNQVIGYLYWSLTDNFEWGKYGPRFGLYSVDVLGDPELRRVPTAAVAAYREVILANGVAGDYQPVIT
ncbi:family 1 glycosylhydrolase [Hydrocarboniphaga sp.]|uniref:family 1 glycosylhydrolase n=1 Tax=Hydrocarboniphaga sp. TaxID=2033016 RepID=UPI003D0D327A